MRVEKDSLGEVQVPSHVYYGAQTERSLEYFSVGFHQMPLEVIEALVLVKRAAVIVNHRLEKISKEKMELILQAIDKLKVDHQNFPLSVWQTGSGTQSNMNVNEVIANVANELAGYPLGGKEPIHPNDHVNLSQSSNDTFPTAMHIATAKCWHEKLLPAVTYMREALQNKVDEFQDVIKIGRTHLMDAVPISLGQEFSGYVAQLDQNLERLEQVLPHLYELALGGTAVGTGLNSHPEFGEMTADVIRELTGLPFVTAPNKFASLASKDPFVFAHSALKTLACSLMKISNDIRWLGSGPRAGFSELILPVNEPGSSIMPGKVNPTQCESMTMVAVHVMGNDTAVTIAASQGNFELNVYKPVILYNMIESLQILSDSCRSFTDHLIKGVQPNMKVIQKNLENSLMLVTALTPHIGYDNAAKVAKKAHNEMRTLKESCVLLGYLTEEEFTKIVDPKNMI